MGIAQELAGVAARAMESAIDSALSDVEAFTDEVSSRVGRARSKIAARKKRA